jgi:hypothetical protein
MLLKAVRFFAVVILMNTLSAIPALANIEIPSTTGNAIVSQSLDAIYTLLPADRFSVKKGQPYDSSNDPAIKSSSGGPSEGPQHGYFAVPLIVIGLAGILLYFSKFN